MYEGGSCQTTYSAACANGTVPTFLVDGTYSGGTCVANGRYVCVCTTWISGCSDGGTGCGSPGSYYDCGLQSY
jgi:hypothetical protein